MISQYHWALWLEWYVRFASHNEETVDSDPNVVVHLKILWAIYMVNLFYKKLE